MRRTPLLGAAAALSLLGAVACSGDDSDSEAELKEQLTSVLERGGEIEAEAADCYADIVIEDVGVEQLQDVDLSATEPEAVSDELEKEIAAATKRADEECELAAPEG